MIRDTLRAALVVAVMAMAAALVVEVRYQIAAIDVAHRAASWQHWQPSAPQPVAEAGPLRKVGRAALDLADAAIGVVR